jgi:cytochrome c biogenesis protein CcmG/thiol:disulfide interchange protein DsbE
MEAPEAHELAVNRRTVSPAWLAACVIAVVIVALLGFAIASGTSQPPQAGNPVPGFELQAFDGSSMNLAEHRGKVVVVNFFASWCDPCRLEAADLEQSWHTYQDRGVQFFGIAYKDADSKARAFLEEYSVSYPSTVERGNRTARAYGLTGVPETFVIDQEGLLVRHFLGPITQAQLSLEIDELLAP